jgi:hypothetical protein
MDWFELRRRNREFFQVKVGIQSQTHIYLWLVSFTKSTSSRSEAMVESKSRLFWVKLGQ